MTVRAVIGWRCTDCDATWKGGALARIDNGVHLTSVGDDVKRHVLEHGHVTAPVMEAAGQLDLFGDAA